jgi:GTP-binding protein HflX
MQESLEELALLARTAGLQVVGHITQTLETIHPATYIGKGKLDEARSILAHTPFDVLLFDVELSPTQQRNIEEVIDAKVLDRTALILDIFAAHARTREGALQVELAQYEYRLPRLTRQWTHLSRQSVGGVGLRGPGETQLESDRRDIRRRIAQLHKSLEDVRSHRELYRRRRREAALSTVALVGYTNAGKSTLLNQISGSDVLVEDKLFATLDPTTRKVALPGGHEVLFTDTVGFIQKLPTTLISAFRATLEEILEAEVMVHVVDITSRTVLGQSWAVAETLRQIGAHDIPLVTALNKIDRLESPEHIQEMLAGFPNSIGVSALTGQGIDQLLTRIGEVLTEQMLDVDLRLPYSAGELAAMIRRYGVVESEDAGRDGVTIRGRVPPALYSQLRKYLF